MSESCFSVERRVHSCIVYLRELTLSLDLRGRRVQRRPQATAAQYCRAAYRQRQQAACGGRIEPTRPTVVREPKYAPTNDIIKK